MNKNKERKHSKEEDLIKARPRNEISRVFKHNRAACFLHDDVDVVVLRLAKR